jgi:hypothetical protein
MASMVARSRSGGFQSVFQDQDQLWEYQCPVILVRRKGRMRSRVLVREIICDKLGNAR